MRVAVVGATGNVGTAVLSALVSAPEVDAILGIARRLPDEHAEPYAHAQWARFDIGRRTSSADDEDALTQSLADLLEGVDAVVHLAWLIQPNHERDLLRRTNVDGTERVARACALAGVTKLVVASSVGAYSPVEGDDLWDESHATGGVATSHYSVDKAAQERVLDVFEAQHPQISVVRLRPALIFQSLAGSEIYRYFLGPWVPGLVARKGLLPVMPWPRGLRLQAVHADDVAQAYVRAVVRPVRGAFNIAADDVLRGGDIARILDHGRLLELPPALIRAGLAVAWRGRVVPTDPGWLDMGAGAPLMDTSRARQELGWSPKHTAAHAVGQVLTGIEQGQGKPTPPMVQRSNRLDSRRADFTGTHQNGDNTMDGELLGARIPEHLDPDLLGLYLSDHITGATAGLNRVQRMAQQDQDLPIGDDLKRLSEQLNEERNLLINLVAALGLPRLRHRQAAAWVAEHLGRLKFNRRLTSRSPITPVLEIELMRSAVNGKAGGWQTLAELAPALGLDPARFAELIDRAQKQSDLLARMHEHVQHAAFER